MKRIVFSALAIAISQSLMATTFQVTIASNSSPVDVNETVYGQTGYYTGYFRVTQNGQVVRSYFGSSTYTWNRTNTGSYARDGYTVEMGAIDFEPDSGIPSHFSNPGTVIWGPEILPEGGGGGN